MRFHIRGTDRNRGMVPIQGYESNLEKSSAYGADSRSKMSDLVLAESFLITGDKNALSSHEPSGSTAVTITIVRDVVEGKFSEVLTTTEAKGLLVQFGEGGKNDFHLSIRNSSDIIGTPEKELFALAVGVACLHSFIQINWTGPDLDFLPSSIFTSTLHISEEDLNAIAVSELAYGGEPAYHLAKAASLLRLAQLIFSLPFQFVQSSPWWSLRSKNVHQQLLDEPVALSPEYFLSLQSDEEKLKDQPADLLGRFILEEGLLRHRVGHDKIAAELFVRSARAMGLEYELTGALGKRTKFQQTDLTQLVLLAESRSRDGNAKETPAGRSEETPSASNAVPATLLLNDDTLLEQTQFTSSSTSSDTHRLSHLNPQSQPALHPLDQSILLAMCLNVKNTSPSHGLTSEQMSPYVARVISHPRNWSVHTMALLIRSRLESGRTRTVERSTLQLQALIDQMPTSDSTLDERLLYFHQLPLPSKWELERELAMRYLSLGVVRSAMEIFERLEMWEEVVKCWQSLERPEKGIAIVRDLLEGRKEESKKVTEEGKEALKPKRAMMDIARQAKLWCLLGDLEPDHAEGHYTHAWEVSNHTSARALRSLGGLHFSRGTYEKAISYLSKAVTINPLFSRTWFILGCAYVREEDWDGAKEAFGRCVGIDDEDGESWSNLASVYLRMSDKQETRTDEVSPVFFDAL
jgi:tetratricopeptide (TPR) repeat protein